MTSFWSPENMEAPVRLGDEHPGARFPLQGSRRDQPRTGSPSRCPGCNFHFAGGVPGPGVCQYCGRQFTVPGAGSPDGSGEPAGRDTPHPACTCLAAFSRDWQAHRDMCPAREALRGAAGTSGSDGASSSFTGDRGAVTAHGGVAGHRHDGGPQADCPDCQYALHEELTGRSPERTHAGWREEFTAFGGDYAWQQMLSLVTEDTWCVIDPPRAAGASRVRCPRIPAPARQVTTISISLLAFAVVSVLILLALGILR